MGYIKTALKIAKKTAPDVSGMSREQLDAAIVSISDELRGPGGADQEEGMMDTVDRLTRLLDAAGGAG